MNKLTKITVFVFFIANVVWYFGFYNPLSQRENYFVTEMESFQKNTIPNLDQIIGKSVHLRDSLKKVIQNKKEKTENINSMGRVERQFKRFCKRYGITCTGFRPQYDLFYKIQQDRPDEPYIPLFIVTNFEGKFPQFLKLMENLDDFESLVYPSFYMEAEQNGGRENVVNATVMLSLIIKNK